MGRFGLLLVVAGVAGLHADEFITVDADKADFVTGGSWVAVIIGALLLLAVMDRGGAGSGIFPLAGGIAALAAQPSTGWMDAPSVEAWRSWTELGIAVLIVGGVLGVITSVASRDGESAVAWLTLSAVAALATDVAADLGRPWDDLANLGTAVFTACSVFGIVLLATDRVEGMLDVPRRVLAAARAGWEHPLVLYLLFWGARLVCGGFGLAAVAITAIATFDLPAVAEAALLLLAVLGAFTVVPVAAYSAVVYVVTPKRYVEAGLDGIIEAAAERQLWVSFAAVLGAGYVTVTSVVTIIVAGPPAPLAALLLVTAAGGGVVAARYGSLAFPSIVERLLDASDDPERTTPSFGEVLGRLSRSDPVFRLLPVSDYLDELVD